MYTVERKAKDVVISQGPNAGKPKTRPFEGLALDLLKQAKEKLRTNKLLRRAG